jgi:hypothetical protein
VTTTTPKAKPKPSLQMKFVLDAMADEAKWDEERWLKMQQSLDILSSKVEAQGVSQHQMMAQLEITTQALSRSSKDQLAFAQQLAATSDVIVRLVAKRHREVRGTGADARGGIHKGFSVHSVSDLHV